MENNIAVQKNQTKMIMIIHLVLFLKIFGLLFAISLLGQTAVLFRFFSSKGSNCVFPQSFQGTVCLEWLSMAGRSHSVRSTALRCLLPLAAALAPVDSCFFCNK